MEESDIACVCPLRIERGLELAENHEIYRYKDKNFLKSFQLSPDGNLINVVDDNNTILTYSLNSSAIQAHAYYESIEEDTGTSLSHAGDSALAGSSYINQQSVIQAGDSIYDAKWYPLMSRDDPATNCFATSCKDHPIHLWDTNSQRIRASYAGYDQYDQLDSAYSFAFNPTGQKIFACTNRVIRVFDISYPGRNYYEIYTCKTRHDFLGQKGIMSCISFNPDGSKAYAVGSYGNSVGIYVEDMDDCALEIRDLNIGGVSCVRWSPCGRMIWIGGRNCNVISCWDVRKTQKEVGRVFRELRTNQKLSFDIDPWGKYLLTGNQDGELLMYETSTFELKYRTSGETATDKIVSNETQRTDDQSVEATTMLDLVPSAVEERDHPTFDCLNTVAFHPFSSLMFSISGQRHFDYNNQPFDLDSDDSDKEDIDSPDREYPDLNASARKHKSYSSGIQIWRAEAMRLQFA